MKRILMVGIALFVIAIVVLAQSKEQLLLSGWKFQRGAIPGAEKADFSDSGWETVSIPHDWAVKGPFDKDIDKQVVAIEQNGERNATEKTGRTGSLPWIGEGWYRTEITIPEGFCSGELIFDGAMAEPRVYIDGREVGYWAYGYNTFSLDITKFLPRNGSKEEHLASGTHTLAVHLQNIEESARWYPGAGIYRPVRLVLHPQNYLKTWGTFARTTMVSGISADATIAREARLYITSEAVIGATLPKGKKLRVRQSLVDAQGNVVAKSEEEAGRHESIHVLTIQNAHLWSPEAPRLYTLVTELIQDNEVCDRMETKVGIRSIEYDEEGFKLNGKTRKFKGVCLHHDHPSIVMWSIGNEIPEQGTTVGLDYTRKLQDLVHHLDGTRPCTQGMDRGTAPMKVGTWQECDIPGFNYRLHVYKEGYRNSPKGIVLGSETASTVSSRGVYKFPVKEEHGTSYPDGQISSYDLESCIWSNLPDDDWVYQDKCPWVIGEFVWTGFDYLGEPTPYDEYWPSRSSYFGIYDLAGLPKDRVWLYRTHWAPEKQTLHLLPHWTWPGREGQNTPVFCYTNYPEAELFVNGKSMGRIRHTDLTLDEYEAHRIEAPMPWGGTSVYADPEAKKNRLDRYRLRWMNVNYEPGEIKVVAYDTKGNKAAEETVRTAGKPDHIELIADRREMPALPMDANGNALDCPSLTFVTARVVDRAGNLCPDADQQLTFSVKGHSASFNSCCNGDATSTEVFTNPTMKAFHGQLVIVLQSTAQSGVSTLTVKGKGLKGGKIDIKTI